MKSGIRYFNSNYKKSGVMKTTGTNPDIEILYEDNHLLAVSKPKGLLSQEDYSGDADLLSLCKDYLKKEYNKPGNVFLGLLHRLDKPVSGVMLFAKTSKAAARISDQIRRRSVSKTYTAVVDGRPPKHAVLTHHLQKDRDANYVKVVSPQAKGAKKAEMMFRLIEQQENLALLKISLITGRAHQIRVQLADQGYPIWGDKKYGTGKHSQIALHASELKVEHPTLKKEMIFTSKPPIEMPWTMFGIMDQG